MKEEKKRELTVVGIGASAGGLEALQDFVKNLPENAPIAYVIAQHLSPTYRSMMAELLGKSASKKVVEIRHGLELEPDTIYITPQNKNVTLEGNVLCLSVPSDEPGPKPSIDHFFYSLSQSKGKNAFGIILSGTGSDGSHGVRAIKAEGGITLAQDPNSAKYDGMPNSAINTGLVDLILEPESMGREILEIIEHPESFSILKEISKDHGPMETIFGLLQQRKNVDFSQYKLTTIGRRVERRMAALRIASLQEYARFVGENPEEINDLFQDILIGVTSFFRDPDSFRELKEQLQEVLEGKDKKQVRIWVPGCSTGEEVYSIAILVAEILGRKAAEYDIQIFGTDIDENATAIARKARYPYPSVMTLEKGIQQKYFTVKNDVFEVIRPIREMVIFSRHNLLRDPPFLKLDLVSCRNLLIYFDVSLQKVLIPMFHYALDNRGLLFLGKSETVGTFMDLFTPIDKKVKIYRRQISSHKELPKVYRTNHSARVATKPLEKVQRDPANTLEKSIVAAIGNHFLPNTVVINEPQEVLYKRGEIPYLSLPTGSSSLNIHKMIHSDLALDLRSALHSAEKNVGLVKTNFRKVSLYGGVGKTVRMLVLPFEMQTNPSRLYLINFQEEDSQVFFKYDLDLGKVSLDDQVKALEHDLINTREQLQAVIEELETSNEEMQSLNEELQSSNEELQSSNEELETTNEELQSTNEELQTAYAELRTTYDEKERQQKQAEAAEKLATQQSRYLNAVIDALPEITVITDHVRLKKANKAFFDFTGFSHLEDFLQKHNCISEFFIPDGRKDFLSDIRPGHWIKQLLGNQGSEKFVMIRMRKRDYIFSVDGRELSFDGSRETVVTFSNITRLTELELYKNALEEKIKSEMQKNKEKEQLLIQQSKLAAMGEMIGAIAHQWRQPLNVIGSRLMFMESEFMGNRLTEKSFDEHVDKINETLKFMSSTIDDFRNFFRPNRNKEVFSLVTSISEILYLIKPQLDSKVIQVDFVDEETIEKKAFGYPNEYKQVMLNLLNNAKEAIVKRIDSHEVSQGLIRISVTTKDGMHLVAIEDNGGGIAEDIMGKIFNPYFTTKFESQGTGIGLYMSKIIIENNMGGKLLASNGSQGAVFTVVLHAV